MLVNKCIFKAWYHIDIFLRLIKLILGIWADRVQAFVQACNQHFVSLWGFHRFKVLVKVIVQFCSLSQMLPVTSRDPRKTSLLLVQRGRWPSFFREIFLGCWAYTRLPRRHVKTIISCINLRNHQMIVSFPITWGLRIFLLQGFHLLHLRHFLF